MVAGYFLLFPIWRAQFLIELWPTESWNAYWQDAAAAGLPIYPDPQGLTGNNYPPLSFYAIGLLAKTLHVDPLYLGRWLSLAGLAALAFEISAAVWLLTGARVWGAAGALWYLAIMARNSTTYVGANDPQIAGLAIMGAALVWLLKRTAADRSPLAPLLLMVAGGFWKHNNIGIPIASIAWLFGSGNRFALKSTLASAAAAVAGLGACVVSFGPNFFPNMLAVRSYGMGTLLANVGHLQWCALALLIWAVWAWSERRTTQAKFTALLIGAGLFSCLLQWLGHGVAGNAEFDLLFALGIGVGVVLAGSDASPLALRIGVDRCRLLIVAALLFRLLASDRQETALVVASDAFRGTFAETERNLILQARQASSVPGNVACHTKLICRSAGKPFLIDEFKVEELLLTGNATRQEIAAKMEANNIQVFAETLPATPSPSTSLGRWLWPTR
ncbi:hypothetical protein [Bradyrhizobium sp. WU425]|uniref:hypothetical protein n=1 Tax=Bradyrhizobium sp. WU425 TaxID=187029 RepID=UPI001E4A97DB|nr:hypothetical protein [Bradyrhizobium canariense]UFW75525.1 hypothetical protein BcanWU425_17840 [Bradyrhizobium canariense]